MQWISVKDKLPPKNVEVLVYSTVNGVRQDHYIQTLPNGTLEFYGDRDEYEWNVTHWMPLPKPPKN